jgi:hypothetical protein
MDLEFTDYALMRMNLRDILEEEVRQALAANPAKHTRRNDGRSEVRERIGSRSLLVVYKTNSEPRLVINAMWE